jgi:hypothetical protein
MGSPSADEISNAAYFLSLHRGGGREPVFDARAASNDYEQAAARLRSMLFGYCIVEKGGSANRIRAFVLDPDLARIWNIILRNEVAEFLISTAFNVSRDPIDWLTWETQSFLRDILLRQGWTVRSFEGIAACWSHQGV